MVIVILCHITQYSRFICFAVVIGDIILIVASNTDDVQAATCARIVQKRQTLDTVLRIATWRHTGQVVFDIVHGASNEAQDTSKVRFSRHLTT